MGNKITRRRPTIDERYTRPQGLYPHRDVDQRKLRRLILDSKLAPCFPGGEDPAADSEECPICFLVHLNTSSYCGFFFMESQFVNELFNSHLVNFQQIMHLYQYEFVD